MDKHVSEMTLYRDEECPHEEPSAEPLWSLTCFDGGPVLTVLDWQCDESIPGTCHLSETGIESIHGQPKSFPGAPRSRRRAEDTPKRDHVRSERRESVVGLREE